MKAAVKVHRDWLKRQINAAKAGKGMSWRDIAEALSDRDTLVSASSLMSKNSRSSFTAVELVLILQVLGVESLDIPKSSIAHE